MSLPFSPVAILRRRRQTILDAGEGEQAAYPVMSGTDWVGLSTSATGDTFILAGTDITGIGAGGSAGIVTRLPDEPTQDMNLVGTE